MHATDNLKVKLLKSLMAKQSNRSFKCAGVLVMAAMNEGDFLWRQI